MLRLKTPAKLNLFLSVGPTRPDGFHEVATVLQTLDLWDGLTVSPATGEARGLHLTCNDPSLVADNLVARAYDFFWQTTGLPPMPIAVHLDKHIPVQAGLGGGSGNAAGMLLALNHLMFSPLSPEALASLAATLGADVPFFLAGGTALATGRGEQLQPLAVNVPRMPVLIVQPRRLPMSTAQAYTALDQAGDLALRPVDGVVSTLHQLRYTTDFAKLEAAAYNSFEPVLLERFPPLADVADRLKHVGAARPLLCGSGSAMAGFLQPTWPTRQAVDRIFPVTEYRVVWSRLLSAGVVQESAPAAQPA